MKNITIATIMLLILLGSVSAMPFTSKADIDLQSRYNIINGGNATLQMCKATIGNFTNVYANHYYYQNGTELNSSGSSSAFTGTINQSNVINWPSSAPVPNAWIVGITNGSFTVAPINETALDTTKFSFTGGLVNRTVCWKSATTLGYCGAINNATGVCACN